MRDYPKPIKQRLRGLMALAYERELQRELRTLDQQFAAWRAGHLSSGAVSHQVHQFDTGPARALWNRYQPRSADLAVAYAVVVGLLRREEVPPEVLAALSGPLSFYQSLHERNELQQPGEI